MDQRSRDFVRGRLADPAWLVRANPRLVIASLEGATDRTQLHAAAVYRTSAHLHQDSNPAVRRQLLALDAARFGDRDFAARLADVSVDGEPAATWRIRWVGGPKSDPRQVRAQSGRMGEVLTVAAGASATRKVAIAGTDDGTVRAWDLVTGKPFGEPIIGHSDCVLATAVTTHKSRLVAITGSDDGVIRLIGLSGGAGTPAGAPLLGHSAPVRAIATSTVGGHPLVVTGSWDQTTRVWDLTEERPVGRRLLGAGHDAEVWAVACTEIHGRPMAVTGSGDETARIWDLTEARQYGDALVGHTAPVHTVATAFGPGGRTLGLTGSWDGTLRIWDLRTSEHLGTIRPGHDDLRWSVATGVLGSRAVAATGGGDGRVRVWDLATREQIGPDLVFPSAVRALATAPGERLVVGFDREVAVLGAR